MALFRAGREFSGNVMVENPPSSNSMSSRETDLCCWEIICNAGEFQGPLSKAGHSIMKSCYVYNRLNPERQTSHHPSD